MARGRFISLEGGEGVGKSTQLRALAEWLGERGRDVVTTREPGGTQGAEAIRALLLNGSDDQWSAGSEALLFAAARADHVERLIRPALERGAWVLCDRFIDSSRAYQGVALGLGDEEIMALHRFGSGGLMPDFTFILDVEPVVAGQRLARRDGDVTDRIGGRDEAFHRRVRDAFRQLAEREPGRIRMIDTDQPREIVTAQIVAALGELGA